MIAEAKSNEKRVTKAGLARAMNVSKAAVTKALFSGRIVAGADGRFDLAAAVQEWRENTRQAMPRIAGGGEHRTGQPQTPYSALEKIAVAHYLLREDAGIALPKQVDATLRKLLAGDTAQSIIERHGYVPEDLKPRRGARGTLEKPANYVRRLLALGCVVLKRKVAEPAC